MTFFAAMVKVQFAAGKDPISSFKDDGSLTIAQIRKLLEERCKYELGAWFLFDRNKDGDYTWKELLPLVKDFWHHIWNKNRPNIIHLTRHIKNNNLSHQKTSFF